MLSDLKLAARSLARARGYAAAAIVTLALGLGTATAFYRTFAQTLFPPLPYREPERLVRVELLGRTDPNPRPVFLLRFAAYREARQFTAVAGAGYETANLVLNGEPEGIVATRVTDNFFALLDARPAVGRLFGSADGVVGADDVVVLSHAFWSERLGADPAAVGRKLKLNERLHRIVGVLAEDFTPPTGIAAQKSIYLPYAVPPTVADADVFLPVNMVACLAPGVAIGQVAAELGAMTPEKGRPTEKFIADFRPVVSPIGAPLAHVWMQRYRAMLWTSLAAVGCLFAIACVNAGGLMLVRMVGRRRELGIRLALGAGRWAVMRPLLAEAMLLAGGAVVLGIAVANWGVPALFALVPGGHATTMRIWSLGADNLAFLAALGVLTGLVVAIGPAWQATRLNPNDLVKDGGAATGESRSLRRWRGGLIVIEAALAVVLLIGAGLMVRMFAEIARQKPGYELEHRYAVSLTRSLRERLSPEQTNERRRLLLERLRAMPGVEDAALGMWIAPSYYYPQKLKIVGRSDGAEIDAQANPVSPEFLRALGLTLKAGRALDTQRPSDAPAVWINETMARAYFAGRNPMGERLQGIGREAWEIAGVVGDQLSQRDGARLYFPYWQAAGWQTGELLLKLAGEAGPKFAVEIRRAVYEVDPKIAVMNVQSLPQQRGMEVANERFASTVLQVLSGLALALAATGLAATMAYTVAQRKTEFGVRLALGATPGSLHRLVLRQGAALAAAGVTIGLGAAWGLTRFLESLLIGTPPRDALTFAAVGLLMIVVALIACWWPARTAARVNVSTLLRWE
jgi:putative ABC transport system permease protein